MTEQEPKLKKTTIKLEIMTDEFDSLEGMSLEDIASEMDAGGFVGTFKIEKEELLNREDSEIELNNMGSDISFFGDVFEDENPSNGM
jgi:hypothetical protein